MKAVLGVTCPSAAVAGRLAVERLGELAPETERGNAGLTVEFAERPGAGFDLDVRRGVARITAQTSQEFNAGVGKLISLAAQFGSPPDGHWAETPRFPIRSHYMPGHFGNPFEAAWPGEMQRYLEDLALWGSSGYSDWFDPNDMPDPYNPHVYCSSSMSLWMRKKQFLRIARSLGLEVGLGICHNVGYVDQMRPEWVGVRSIKHRVQGQVLCPSIPEARAVCLRNHENLLADLAESGITIDRIGYAPYDDGGCACPKCQPYFPIFLKMAAEIHEIARRYFPGIRADICGWWMNSEETEMVREFAAGAGKDWFHAFQVSVAYDAFGASDAAKALEGLRSSVFLHVSYSGDKRDVYLASGIHSAPARLRHVADTITQIGGIGFTTYNESFGDHFNQFLCTRLARTPTEDTRDMTRDYCRRMYQLQGADLEAMATVLGEMESLDESKASAWVTTLASLRPRVRIPAEQPWAFDHVALKAELLELDHRIGTGETWRISADIDPVRPLIRQRLTLSERLWRRVYGLATLRHIFIPAFMMPPWHGRLLAIEPELVGRVKLDFVRVSKQA